MNVFIVGFLRWHGLNDTTLFLKLIEPQGGGGGGGGIYWACLFFVLFSHLFFIYFFGGGGFRVFFRFLFCFFSLFFRFCCLSVGLVFCCFLVLFLFVLFRVLFFSCLCVCVCVVLCFCCCCCLFFCFFVVVFSSFLGVGIERKLAFNAQSTVTVMRERGGVRGFIIASV